MKPVLTAEEMQVVDKAAIADVGFEVLVERAGGAVARTAIAMLGGTYGRRIVVVAGKGHNGDDGRVAARILKNRGARVVVLPAGEAAVLPVSDLVIDGAFGTGFRGTYVAPQVGESAQVLAIDIPSGVNADNGVACDGATVADRTISLGGLKPGLLFADGPAHSGHVEVDGIGLDVGAPLQHLVEDADVQAMLPPRHHDGHKWDAAVYVVAGSPGMLGAAALVVSGAYRSGAGMVRLSSPGVELGSVPVREVVTRSFPAADWAEQLLVDAGRCKALAVGPGLGNLEVTREQICRLVARASMSVVLDADGLNAIASVEQLASLCKSRTAPLVLTPHDGEYRRLVGDPPGTDRLSAARSLAAASGATVLLKGSPTVVAAPAGEALIVSAGSPRLSTAGTGDVLSGVIAAFIARGLDPLRATGLAAHVHGRAAAIGHAEGLIASDLPELIATVLSGTAGSGEPIGKRSGSATARRSGEVRDG